MLLFTVGLVSCTDEDNDTLTGSENVGGLIDVNSPLVAYVVGNGNTFEYPASFDVFQGAVQTTQVEVYKVFTNVAGVSSNEVLFKTIDVPAAPQVQTINFAATYNELIAGLTIGGNPLPASDSSLNIGDYWTLKYVAKTSSGASHANVGTTKISVGTRFAGTYKVISGSYWRIGVPNTSVLATWIGSLRTIESVNATTYKFLNYAGPFGAVTNTHYFTIDGSDVVRTPVMYNGAAQLLNGYGVINCEETPSLITNACSVAGPQNTVVRDNVAGKDLIYRTYGYNTTSGAVGPREIYEVLEKVVD